jgi:hypothetical protein
VRLECERRQAERVAGCVREREARYESVSKRLKRANERHGIRAKGKGASAKGKCVSESERQCVGKTLCEREA